MAMPVSSGSVSNVAGEAGRSKISALKMMLERDVRSGRDGRNGLGGTILQNRYQLDCRLGSGAVTEVYAAYDLQRQRACAIKLVRAGADPKLEPQRRFEEEVSIVSRLSHAHIAEVYAFDRTTDGQLFLVMEMLQGRTLQDLLTEVGMLPWSKVLELALPIASALKYMHALGVLHPSIRPGTIFLHDAEPGAQSSTDSAPRVKLFDFGVAKAGTLAGRQGNAALSPGAIVGTPGYVPPELLEPGSAPIDARADQWSFAALLYRAVAGRLPFQAPEPYLLCALIRTTEPTPLAQLRPELPKQVCAAIDRALSRNPQDRFACLDDFMRALTHESKKKRSQRTERPRSDLPQTVKFDSGDLAELCKMSAANDAVPQPIDVCDTTSRYTESAPQRLIAQSQETEPSATSLTSAASLASVAIAAPRRDRTHLLAICALVLMALTTLFALSLRLHKGTKAKLLQAAANESSVVIDRANLSHTQIIPPTQAEPELEPVPVPVTASACAAEPQKFAKPEVAPTRLAMRPKSNLQASAPVTPKLKPSLPPIRPELDAQPATQPSPPPAVEEQTTTQIVD